MRTASQTAQTPCSTSYLNAGRSSCRRTRLAVVRCSEHGIEEAPGAVLREPKPLVVKSIPVTRSAAPPPQPVPVEHSSAYLLRNRRDLSAAEQEVQQQPEAFSGNAVEWVLKKADQSLDEIEENPPEYAKVLYDLSSGPLGKAATSSVTTAAKVTVQVGAEALKAAAPVGKWALQQGLKLAVTAVSKGLASGSSSSSSEKKDGKSK